MIAANGSVVVHLGGWRGDRLSLGRAGEGFRRIADLGWDARAQATPQRRLMFDGDTILVLEPVSGPVLAPPLRVRRLDLAGREVAREEGDGDDGHAALYFHHSPDGALVRYGIDPATGRPTAWRGSLDLGDRILKPKPLSGTPLFADDAWWYPVRMEGVWRVGAETRFWRGRPGLAAEIGGTVVWPGCDRDGAHLWVAGTPLELDGALFPLWTPPIFPWVAPGPEGLVVLRREGGALPAIDPATLHTPAPPRLPAGPYSSLVALPEGVFAVAEGPEPDLVPVTF